jgi:hypothetical protein
MRSAKSPSQREVSNPTRIRKRAIKPAHRIDKIYRNFIIFTVTDRRKEKSTRGWRKPNLLGEETAFKPLRRESLSSIWLFLSDSPQLMQRSPPFLFEAPQFVQNIFVSLVFGRLNLQV